MNPEWAKTQLAFSIRIPRVVPKDPVIFQIATINQDNQNAGGQILRLREEFSTVLKMVIERLEKINPEAAKGLNFEKLVAFQIKQDALFKPARFSYEAGRHMIEYFTEEEQVADALFRDIRKQHKEVVEGILDSRPKFIAPVIRIKTIRGRGLSFTGTPLTEFCLQFGGKPDRNSNLPVIVPTSYGDGICKPLLPANP
jgi:hypothetical protein